MDSEQACAAGLHGDLEIGIVTLPLEPIDTLIMKKIWDAPLSMVMGKPIHWQKRKVSRLNNSQNMPRSYLRVAPIHVKYWNAALRL